MAAPRGVGGERGGAGGDRASAGVGDRGGDRCLLSAKWATSAPRKRLSEAFAPEIEEALERDPVDFKSALQELLAQRGLDGDLRGDRRSKVRRTNRRTFEVAAKVEGAALGSGSRAAARSTPEQQAAREAVEAPARGTATEPSMRLKLIHIRKASSPSRTARVWTSAQA